jgi:ubiquinone/menaquinone biosynthesis C-methylase UbiE
MTTAADTDDRPAAEPHLCPVWVGHLLASPLRRLFEKPERILRPHVREGDTVLDLGCAMGFFTLPLAKLVGPRGRVVALDVQEGMIRSLRRKLRRRRLESVVEARICRGDGLGLEDLEGAADVALAWHVVHEVRDRAGFFRECRAALRSGGRLLLGEPAGHVGEEDFAAELELARAAGFRVVGRERSRRSLMAQLEA